MLKAVNELQAMDTFRHLNGKLFTVVKVDWVAGDQYIVVCMDNKNKMVQYLADVHTAFEVVMTYSAKVGA
jgi:hypothetical protein